MTLTDVVAQLRACGYTCEAGRLEDNVAFRELEQTAALWDKMLAIFYGVPSGEAWQARRNVATNVANPPASRVGE